MPETTANAVFVDTNILVYANLTASPFYDQAIKQLNTLSEQGCALWISRQVLREYLASMTRRERLTGNIPMTPLLEDVRRFSEHFHLAEDSEAVTARLLALMEQIPIGGAQVHDANLVATMQVYGIS